MDAPKSEAKEVQPYRHSLETSGFREVTEGKAEHADLLGDLESVLRELFHESPSPTKKTFWVHESNIG